jgi:hypothetical protein
MVDETYFDWHNIINNIEELGDIMDVQELMEKDKFWGHYELQERIENKDTTLLDKKFYDLTYERSWEELRDILFDLIDSIDGIKIESRDSY